MVYEGRKRGRNSSPRGKDIDDLDKESSISISNIPYTMRWEQLRDIFVKEVGEVIYVKLFKDENDRPSGVGYVTFNTPELADIAKSKLDRYQIDDRELVVKDASYAEKFKARRSGREDDRSQNKRPNKQDKQRDKQDLRRRLQPQMGGRSGDGKDLYGLSPEFLESLGIDPSQALHNRLFVKNLDYGVDEVQLRDAFRLAGRVVCVKILRDKKDGKSSGLGIVEYSHPVEAVQAISMLDSQMFYARKLMVNLDRSTEEDSYNCSPESLPEGLQAIGRGLGPNGMPLTDVANNLPTMAPQPIYTYPVEGSGNMPLPANATINVPAMEAISKGIIANQNVNAVNSALSILQSVPGLSSILNLGAGNIVGGNNLNNFPLKQAPVQSNVPMETNYAPNSGYLPNLFQSIPGNAAFQGNSHAVKHEALHSAQPVQILPQVNHPVMVTAPQIDHGGFVEKLFERTSSNSNTYGKEFVAAESPQTEQSVGQGDRTSLLPSFNSSDISASGISNTTASRYSHGTPSLLDAVVVKNLPEDCTSKILKDGFTQCGEIIYCEIRGPGVGVIRFDAAKAAQIAIARMNNQNIAGKNLVVEYL